jgi:hypothetical protein
MGAVANLVLADGQVSPVNHTFVPSRESETGTFTYVDKVSGIVTSYNKTVVGSSIPSNVVGKGERNFRIKWSIHVPTSEALPDNPTLYKVSYTTRASGEFVIPERSIAQNRKDVLAYTKNLMAHALMTALVVDLDSQF